MCQIALVLGDPHPVGHRPRDPGCIRGQRGIVMQVVGGVIADHIDHRRSCAPGIVQIGKAVPQSRTKMQQSHRRLVSHAAVTIRRAGHHAFEQSQNSAHTMLPVNRCDQLHFRGARVGEADFDPAGGQCFDKGFGPVHARILHKW